MTWYPSPGPTLPSLVIQAEISWMVIIIIIIIITIIITWMVSTAAPRNSDSR